MQESVRQKILNIAADEIHQNGFQACSISQIMQRADVSKGAVYHHFSNKNELGYAVFDEVFRPIHDEMWKPVYTSKKPIDSMIEYFEQILTWLSEERLCRGCPITNLSQEMSSVDEGFRLRINDLISNWTHSIEKALAKSQSVGELSAKVNTEQTALFIISSLLGAQGIAKNAQKIDVMKKCVNGCIEYLRYLKTL